MRAFFSAQWFSAIWALGFLSRLPLPAVVFTKTLVKPANAPFYLPWVGSILAMLLVIVGYWITPWLPAPMSAGLLVMVWVWITGALHLDGLSDSFDALAAGHKPQCDLFSVLKDPCCGAWGVSSIVLVLVLKMVAMFYLLGFYELWVLILPLALARLAVQGFVLITPCAKPEGFGALVSVNPKKTGVWVGLILNVLILCVLGWFFIGPFFLVLLGIVGAWTVYWRHQWIKILKGYVGDTLGALIEIVELLMMVTLVGIAAHV